MARPSDLPTWNTDDVNNTPPNSAKKALGWIVGDIWNTAYSNWWQKLVYEWVKYFDEEKGAETIPGGRLTLTTGVPVTISDVSGAATVYYSPHVSARVPLFDGTVWGSRSFTELSQTLADTTKSPAAAVLNANYDMFVWLDGVTLRCTRGPAWTSDTARGTGAGTTELERVDGRWVNKVAILNGPLAQRGLYVGTIRTDGSVQVNDSATKRHVWNAYNRARRGLRVTESNVSWVHNAASYRQVNGAATNQVDIVRGLDEDSLELVANARVACSSGTGSVLTAIGLDSTTAAASGSVFGNINLQVTGVAIGVQSFWHGTPGLGRHYLAWLEYGLAATTTWYGTPGVGGAVLGLSGECLA